MKAEPRAVGRPSPTLVAPLRKPRAVPPPLGIDLKKLPSTTMRKTCANDALPKKCWKKTVTTVDKDLEELELKDDSALNTLDAEMTSVA